MAVELPFNAAPATLVRRRARIADGVAHGVADCFTHGISYKLAHYVAHDVPDYVADCFTHVLSSIGARHE